MIGRDEIISEKKKRISQGDKVEKFSTSLLAFIALKLLLLFLNLSSDVVGYGQNTASCVPFLLLLN